MDFRFNSHGADDEDGSRQVRRHDVQEQGDGDLEEWTMSFSDAGLVMVQLILTRSNFVDEEGG